MAIHIFLHHSKAFYSVGVGHITLLWTIICCCYSCGVCELLILRLKSFIINIIESNKIVHKKIIFETSGTVVTQGSVIFTL